MLIASVKATNKAQELQEAEERQDEDDFRDYGITRWDDSNEGYY